MLVEQKIKRYKIKRLIIDISRDKFFQGFQVFFIIERYKQLN